MNIQKGLKAVSPVTSADSVTGETLIASTSSEAEKATCRNNTIVSGASVVGGLCQTVSPEAENVGSTIERLNTYESFPDRNPIPVERHPFEPFLPANAKVLMLGSFPPQSKRWSIDFYYPNFINDMWRIMGLIFFNDKNRFVDVAAKKFRLEDIVDFCTGTGIAMYDTATAVRRLKDNASDKFLEVVTPTDIPALLRQIPQCQAIVTTGEKATDPLCPTFGTSAPATGEYSEFHFEGRPMRLYRMPSSSRAYPLPLEQKAAAYRGLFSALHMVSPHKVEAPVQADSASPRCRSTARPNGDVLRCDPTPHLRQHFNPISSPESAARHAWVTLPSIFVARECSTTRLGNTVAHFRRPRVQHDTFRRHFSPFSLPKGARQNDVRMNGTLRQQNPHFPSPRGLGYFYLMS